MKLAAQVTQVTQVPQVTQGPQVTQVTQVTQGAEDATGDGSGRELRYGLIELMFFAYRDFVEDADRVLVSDGFGRAHHRVLYFAARRPGLTIAELLDILKITKQSLNRVLKDLLDRGYVINRLGEADRRQRRLTATPRGAALIQQIAEIQSARFTRAFERLGPDAAAGAAAFLEAMVEPSDGRDVGLLDGPLDSSDEFDRVGEAKIAELFGRHHTGT